MDDRGSTRPKLAGAGIALVLPLAAAGGVGVVVVLGERVTPWLGMALAGVALAWPHPAPAVALVGAVAATLGVRAWATRQLGGVNGDVFGAVNEVARVTALHAGVVTWTLW